MLCLRSLAQALPQMGPVPRASLATSAFLTFSKVSCVELRIVPWHHGHDGKITHRANQQQRKVEIRREVDPNRAPYGGCHNIRDWAT